MPWQACVPLCIARQGAAACFFDDDDWRSSDSVQAMLEQLAAADAEICTLQARRMHDRFLRAPPTFPRACQVQYVCELDTAAQTARYFHLPGLQQPNLAPRAHEGCHLCLGCCADGGGVFSARLGNPGTLLLRRAVWESNKALGFPDTPAEDVDYVRLLTAETPLLASYRRADRHPFLLSTLRNWTARPVRGAVAPGRIAARTHCSMLPCFPASRASRSR